MWAFSKQVGITALAVVLIAGPAFAQGSHSSGGSTARGSTSTVPHGASPSSTTRGINSIVAPTTGPFAEPPFTPAGSGTVSPGIPAPSTQQAVPSIGNNPAYQGTGGSAMTTPGTSTTTTTTGPVGDETGSMPAITDSSQVSPEIGLPGTNQADITDPTGITGGTASGGGRPGNANSASGGSATGGSTGESGNSSPGAYGATMSQCMSVWDASSHMSKKEWRDACQRTVTRGE